MNEEWIKWFVGGFIGVLLGLYLFKRNDGKGWLGSAPSTTKEVPRNSFSVLIGCSNIVCCADGSLDPEKFNGIPPSTNDVIPLSTDYLDCDYGLAPTVGQLNITVYDEYFDGNQSTPCQTSTPTLCGTAGPDSFVKNPLVLPEINCNPVIRIQIPNTCTV